MLLKIDLPRIIRTDVFKYTSSSLLSRLISIAIPFILFPLILKEYGSDSLATWILFYSIISLIGFADFGILNGIVNPITKYYKENDTAQIGSILTASIYILSIVTLLWSAIYYVIYVLKFLPAQNSSLLFFIFFFLSLPFSVFQKYLYATERGHIYNLIEFTSKLIMLITSFLLIRLNVSFIFIVGLITSNLAISGILSMIYTMLYSSVKLFKGSGKGEKIYTTFKEGWTFLLINASYAVAFSLDSVLVYHLVAKSDFIAYGTSRRIFDFLILLTSLYAGLLWPKIKVRILQKDYGKASQITIFSLLFCLTSSILIGLPLLVFSKDIIKIWLSSNISTDSWLNILILIFTIVTCIGTVTSNIGFGVLKSKTQMKIYILFAFSSLLAKIYFSKIYSLSGFLIAAILFQTAFFIAPLLYRIFKEITTGKEMK